MNTNSNKKTEEILFQTIRRRKKEEISPSNTLKNKLDKALATKRCEKSFFALRIPSYQSVAAAAIFFVLGLGTNFLRLATVSPKIVHVPTEVEVIKYVDRPVVTEVVKYMDKPVVEIRYIKEPIAQQPTIHDIWAQNVALDNSDESLGISLREDTILQKMLVTIY